MNIYAQRYCNESYSFGGRNGQRIQASLPNKFQSDLLCAGLRLTGQGSCLGDSGGPLVLYLTGNDQPYYLQLGLVSGGFGDCGSANFPGIYVRLEDYNVLEWVYKVALGRKLASPVEPTRLISPTRPTARSRGMLI